MDIKPNDKIFVCWRLVPAECKPFERTGEYNYSDFISASETPMKNGAINGKQIFDFILSKNIDKQIVNIEIAEVKEDEENPGENSHSLLMITNEDTSWYTLYVRNRENIGFTIFIDVSVSNHTLNSGDEINVKWRKIQSEEESLYKYDMSGDFDKSAIIKCEETVYGKGGIKGKTLYNFILKQNQDINIYGLCVRNDEIKSTKSGAINTFQSDNFLYNRYIINENNEKCIYMDVLHS